jgi:rod shape determining protein RodA
MDWLLVMVVLALSAIGTLLVWSATEPSLAAAGQDPRTYLKKQLLNVVIGLVLMAAVSFADTRQLRTWAPLLYGLTLLALLAVLTPAGSAINGAHAWFSLPGGFQVEPSEFAKVALVLVTATVFGRARTGSPGMPGSPGGSGVPGVRSLLLALACAIPLIALVVVEPALGVALVLIVITATMIVLSGLRLRLIAALAVIAGVAVAAAGGLNLLKDYQLTRFTSFLHPSADLAGAGYNAAQAKIAVGSGGMFGQGLFHGQLVAGNFVPSQQTDFIFTVAGEELGFVGTITIVVLLGVVIVRALRIATRADDLFGLLVASGIAIWFAFQSFVNIGMTIGIMPITGLPLPFVSYGGSAVFADMIAIGVLQSVHRRHRVFDLPGSQPRRPANPAAARRLRVQSALRLANPGGRPPPPGAVGPASGQPGGRRPFSALPPCFSYERAIQISRCGPRRSGVQRPLAWASRPMLAGRHLNSPRGPFR